MTSSHVGNFVVTTHSGDVFAAEELKASAKGVQIKHGGGLSGTVASEEIDEIFKIQNPVMPLDQIRESNKLAATFVALENIIDSFAKERGVDREGLTRAHAFSIFGSSSLSLTVLPSRTSDDIDIVASVGFVEFVNANDFPRVEMSVEVIEPQIMFLMGDWKDRTCLMQGYRGTTFDVMHPLDTAMQKLLRMNHERFEIKDKADISAIMHRFHPSPETVLRLLSENPARYFPAPFGSNDQNLAVKRNTEWFLSEFSPQMSYESLVKHSIEASEKITNKIDSKNNLDHVEPLPGFSLQDKIRLVKIEKGNDGIGLP